MTIEEIRALVGDVDKAEQIVREIDRRVQQGVETYQRKFQEEKLPTLLEKAAADKQQQDADAKFKMRAKGLDYAIEHKLPFSLVEPLLVPDEEKSMAALNDLKTQIETAATSLVNERLKSAPDPRKSTRPTVLNRESLKRMSPEAISEAYQRGQLDNLIGRS